MNPVILTFRYEQRDYARAMRTHYSTPRRLRLDILVIVLGGANGLWLWQSPRQHWLGVACVVGAAVFALILLAAFTLIPARLFRTEPKFRDEYRLVFSTEGIHFHTAQIDSHVQWQMYSHALVDANSYLLYYGVRQFTIIPRRVFTSEEQRAAFEQLLTGNISKITRRDG